MTLEVNRPSVIVLTGPTGIGKTSLSLRLAEHIPVEIVSADSRQIYRKMDIGTAKPNRKEHNQVAHHFLDILDPDQDYSAGQYSQAARKVIAEIFLRERVPLVVGGSGLYIRALLKGFFKEDVKDLDLRQALFADAEKDGYQALHDRLNSIDPQAAATIHPNNIRRVVRALEVSLTAGQPISEIQRENRDPAPFSWHKFVLIMNREQLYERINLRVAQMLNDGLVAEVKSLLELGYHGELNAMNSVGYKEVLSYLGGEIDLDTCRELIQQNTRRYAKRQLSWCRTEPDNIYLPIDTPEDISAAIETILQHWDSTSHQPVA